MGGLGNGWADARLGSAAEANQARSYFRGDPTMISSDTVTSDAMEEVTATLSVRTLVNGIALLPGMIVFTCGQPDELGYAAVLSLHDLNRIARKETEVHWSAVQRGDLGHFEFHKAIDFYGEKGLEEYARARRERAPAAYLNALDSATIGGGAWGLRELWEKSTSDDFCYLTRYGILQRIRYLGVISSVGAVATSAGTQYFGATGSHLLTISVGVGKRSRVTNVFGDSDQLTVGTRLSLILNREGPFAPFAILPYASKLRPEPSNAQMRYFSGLGQWCRGFRWIVGVVIDMPTVACSALSRSQAVKDKIPPEDVAEIHKGLPMFYAALGYKH